jgi:PE family protein
MSTLVVAVPDAIAVASGELTGVEEALRDAAAAAAPPTTGIVAAAEDEVSAAIADYFGGYADEFHAVTAQAGVFHTRFVSALNRSGAAYAAGEAGNVRLRATRRPADHPGSGHRSRTAVTGRPVVRAR